MKRFILILCLFPCITLLGQNTKKVDLIISPGEFWWTGISSIGHQTMCRLIALFLLLFTVSIVSANAESLGLFSNKESGKVQFAVSEIETCT